MRTALDHDAVLSHHMASDSAGCLTFAEAWENVLKSLIEFKMALDPASSMSPGKPVFDEITLRSELLSPHD